MKLHHCAYKIAIGQLELTQKFLIANIIRIFTLQNPFKKKIYPQQDLGSTYAGNKSSSSSQ